MYWVLDVGLKREKRTVQLISALDALDQHYSLVKVVPFVGETIPDLVFPQGEKVICLGSYSLRRTAISKNWRPGIYDIEWFPYQSLIDHFGQLVLNGDGIVTSFAELEPKSDKIFLRPNSDGKEFAGGIFTREQIEKWKYQIIELEQQQSGASITAKTLVVASSVKAIAAERRYFVVGGQVVTGSLYKRGSTVLYDGSDVDYQQAQWFADKLNSKISDPYVLDLATLVSGETKIIELNTLNCAGFYDSDVQKLVYHLIEYENNR